MANSPSFPDLTFNSGANIQARHIGLEKMPLLIIDDVLAHPGQMVDYAAASGKFIQPAQGSYFPGLNGDLPPLYGHAIVSALRPLLHRLFGTPLNRDIRYEGFLGLSLFPDTIAPLQTIPHFDSCRPERLAMVHYFCAPPFRGTAFYRHYATEYETIGLERVARYRRAVSEELALSSEQSFADSETENYSLIDLVDMQFNRLIVYRSTSLHCALLNETPLSSDARKGRLTANSFIEPV